MTPHTPSTLLRQGEELPLTASRTQGVPELGTNLQLLWQEGQRQEGPMPRAPPGANVMALPRGHPEHLPQLGPWPGLRPSSPQTPAAGPAVPAGTRPTAVPRRVCQSEGPGLSRKQKVPAHPSVLPRWADPCNHQGRQPGQLRGHRRSGRESRAPSASRQGGPVCGTELAGRQPPAPSPCRAALWPGRLPPWVPARAVSPGGPVGSGACLLQRALGLPSGRSQKGGSWAGLAALGPG